MWIAETEIIWLGYKINRNGIIPKEKKKMHLIAQLEQPQT